MRNAERYCIKSRGIVNALRLFVQHPKWFIDHWKYVVCCFYRISPV